MFALKPRRVGAEFQNTREVNLRIRIKMGLSINFTNVFYVLLSIVVLIRELVVLSVRGRLESLAGLKMGHTREGGLHARPLLAEIQTWVGRPPMS